MLCKRCMYLSEDEAGDPKCSMTEENIIEMNDYTGCEHGEEWNHEEKYYGKVEYGELGKPMQEGKQEG